jgi:uncharacterized membrane protein
MTNVSAIAGEDAPPLKDRILAGAAYLSGIVSVLWFFPPLLFYFWKGKTSRFIGFHAVQATLLGLALILVYCGLGCAAMNMQYMIKHDIASTMSDALMGAAILVPFIASPWLAVSVMRGRNPALPILGRFADEIISTKVTDAARSDDGPLVASTPGERILGGCAYPSSLLPGLWFLSPLVLYLWKGRKSRFIGFHAVQALLLDVALLPAMGALVILSFWFQMVLGGRRPSAFAYVATTTTWMLAFFLPFIVNVWLGVRVMRGRPGVVVLLGWLARRLVRPPA